MRRVFVILALSVLIGCHPKVEKNVPISFADLSKRSFVTSPHILDEDSFSVIEDVEMQKTKYSTIQVSSEQKHCTINSIVFPDSYNDIAYLPAANKFLGFKTPQQSINEVFWLTDNGSKQKISLLTDREEASLPNIKLCLILGVFPSTNAFALQSYGRGEDENRVLLYQMKDTENLFLESEVSIDFTKGDWLLPTSFYCDEERNLFGIISADGYPRIWRVLPIGYEEIAKASLDYKAISYEEFGRSRAAVSPDSGYIAISRDNLIGRQDLDINNPLKDVYCDLRVWSLESGKIIYELKNIDYQESMSIEFIDEYTIILIGTNTCSVVDIQSPSQDIVKVQTNHRERIFQTMRLNNTTLLQVGLKGGHKIEIEQLEKVLKKRINEPQ